MVITSMPTPKANQDCPLLTMLHRDAIDYLLLITDCPTTVKNLGRTCRQLRAHAAAIHDHMLALQLDGSREVDPDRRLTLPTLVPSPDDAALRSRQLLSTLVRPATSAKRVQCFLVRRKALFSRFDFYAQNGPGGRSERLLSARRNAFASSVYTIRLLDRPVAEIYFDRATSSFSLVELGSDETQQMQSQQQQRKGKGTAGRKAACKELAPSLQVSIHRSRVRPRSLKVKLPGVTKPTGAPTAVEVSSPDSPASTTCSDSSYSSSSVAGSSVASPIRDSDQLAHKDIADAASAAAAAPQFVNIEPRWDEGLKHYVLRYYGRAKLASVKNVQLRQKSEHVEQQLKLGKLDEAEVSYLVGKMDDDRFNIDFKDGFSFLSAFALAIVIIDSPSFISL